VRDWCNHKATIAPLHHSPHPAIFGRPKCRPVPGHQGRLPAVFGRRRRVSPRHGPDARRPKTVGENRYTPYRIGPESEGLSQGFGWAAGPSEAPPSTPARSVATQEPRSAARAPWAEMRNISKALECCCRGLVNCFSRTRDDDCDGAAVDPACALLGPLCQTYALMATIILL
jgi:hypothetical protein